MPKSRLVRRKKNKRVVKVSKKCDYDKAALWNEATQHRQDIDIIADTEDGIAAQNDVDDELCDLE